eukprot:COSAG02_NODE_65214_length_258_cov_1.106918_1_plen_64_part_01
MYGKTQLGHTIETNCPTSQQHMKDGSVICWPTRERQNVARAWHQGAARKFKVEREGGRETLDRI